MSEASSPFGTKTPTTRVCPVCGSTALMVHVLANACQDSYGKWQIEYDDELLDDECTNPNTPCMCTNSECGNPHVDGVEVDLDPNESFLEYWLKHYADLDEVTVGNYLKDINEGKSEEVIRKTNYRKWVEEHISFFPWEGTIGDTIALE